LKRKLDLIVKLEVDFYEAFKYIKYLKRLMFVFCPSWSFKILRNTKKNLHKMLIPARFDTCNTQALPGKSVYDKMLKSDSTVRKFFD
jgi:hypothetical protein